MIQVVPAFPQPSIQPLGSLGFDIKRFSCSFSVTTLSPMHSASATSVSTTFALRFMLTMKSTLALRLMLTVKSTPTVRSMRAVRVMLAVKAMISVYEFFLMIVCIAFPFAALTISMFSSRKLRNPIHPAPSLAFELGCTLYF